MSYFDGPSKGYGWDAGHFLADDETCLRTTMTIAANHSQAVTRDNGRTVVPAGAVIPSNDGNAKGILFEDIDVTEGAKPGSVVTEGVVYEDLLPAAIESTAEAVLAGITVIATSPAITRPDWFSKEFAALTVQSAAGTAAGDTAVTVTGYTPASGESMKYKVGDAAQPVSLGSTIDNTWSTYTAGTDITAATGKTITVVAVDAGGYVVAAGSATVTAKA